MDLYGSTPGATLKGVGVDLGMSRAALREWVDKLGSGNAADRPGASETLTPVGRRESQAVRITRLEAELATSRAEARKLETERDILRQAAEYFAGETRW